MLAFAEAGHSRAGFLRTAVNFRIGFGRSLYRTRSANWGCALVVTFRSALPKFSACARWANSALAFLFLTLCRGNVEDEGSGARRTSVAALPPQVPSTSA